MSKPISRKVVAPSTPNPSTVDAATADAEVVGSAVAVELHRAAAEALAPADVVPCEANTRLAYHNAIAGRDALLAHRADVDATGFHVDWSRVGSVESVASAVIYAAGRVEANPRQTGEVDGLLDEARPLRRLLLAQAQALALSGRCPAPEVARIARGRGPVDTAQDLADLAHLYDAHALAGASGVVHAAQVERARSLGDLLLKRIRPDGLDVRRRRTTEQRSAAALRDRLWTLLLNDYRHLEQAAGALWGARMREHLPALQTRRSSRKRRPKPAVPPG